MTQTAILIVDDDASVRSGLGALLVAAGYAVDTAADAAEALARIEHSRPELVLVDWSVPGVERLTRSTPDAAAAIVLMIAEAELPSAIAAIRAGAAVDYVKKPLDLDEISIVVERALEQRRLRAEVNELRARLEARHSLRESIVGSSPEMQRLLRAIAQAALSRAPLLISGEPGTGKALLAAWIHEHSPRAGLFVPLRGVALAETVNLDELLGFERGARMGAVAWDGRSAQHRRGTLFFDEIANLSALGQAELLHVLEARAFGRAGRSGAPFSDIRVIAATSYDLGELALAGRFNEELYHLLSTIELRLPPLRERASDIPELAMHFLRRFATEFDQPVRSISSAALRELTSYAWPGNVRELEDTIQRALALCDGAQLEVRHLPAGVAEPLGRTPPKVPGASLWELERYAILQTMEAVFGSTNRAAQVLGISVRKIQYKLQEYGSSEAEPRRRASSDSDASEN